MTSADLLLHPVRLRIVQCFLGDRALTTTGLRADLPDVPAASLYRHVARLVAGGVLAVVAERRVRGAVERTYVLRAAAARIGLDEVMKMSPEEHRQAFLAFIAGLIGDFDRYLARGPVDPLRDGASYSLAGIWLDDGELLELGRGLLLAVQPLLANAPRPGRRRRILATVLLPGRTGRPPHRGTPEPSVIRKGCRRRRRESMRPGTPTCGCPSAGTETRLSIYLTIAGARLRIRGVVGRAEELGQVFQALADPSRRAIVERLVRGPASVSELAGPLPMSLPAVAQHLGVLESAGVVSSAKVGRVRTCRLEHEVLRRAEAWLGAQRTTWEHRLDRLGAELSGSDGQLPGRPRRTDPTSDPNRP